MILNKKSQKYNKICKVWKVGGQVQNKKIQKCQIKKKNRKMCMPTPEKPLCKVFKKLESKFKIHSNFGKRWNSAVADICLLTTQLTAEKGKKMPPLFLSSWFMETLLKFLPEIVLALGKPPLSSLHRLCALHIARRWVSDQVKGMN